MARKETSRAGIGPEGANLFQEVTPAEDIPIKIPPLEAPALFSNDFYKNPLPAEAVKFPVKDLLPRAEVEGALGDRHNNLPAHNRTLEVGVGIVLAAIVGVLGVREFGGKAFQPLLKVPVETGFVVVDKDACGDVHGVYQAEAFANSARSQALVNLRGDVHKPPAGRDLEP